MGQGRGGGDNVRGIWEKVLLGCKGCGSRSDKRGIGLLLGGEPMCGGEFHGELLMMACGDDIVIRNGGRVLNKWLIKGKEDGCE